MEIIELGCKCCGTVVRMSRSNAERTYRAAQLRWPTSEGFWFNASRVPSDVDLTDPLSAGDIRRVVEACIEPKGARQEGHRG